ncbi:MAG: hypothetical protein IPI38_17410 [Gemmatimonadetes bacterium]|nr:hypothetical protein [Gemmatimonadota bacterium]
MCHGIFLTQDPIGLAGGVNLYAYAGDNPIASDDPFGLCDPPDSPICKFIVGVASHPSSATRQESECDPGGCEPSGGRNGRWCSD